LCSSWVPKMLTDEHKMKQQACALTFLTWYSEHGRVTGDETLGVTRTPWIEAAVHAMEAHIITNKETIQRDHFISQDHVHSVLGQKRHSACRILTSRLNNQRRCPLWHT
jgi:hypothetical protein